MFPHSKISHDYETSVSEIVILWVLINIDNMKSGPLDLFTHAADGIDNNSTRQLHVAEKTLYELQSFRSRFGVL